VHSTGQPDDAAGIGGDYRIDWMTSFNHAIEQGLALFAYSILALGRVRFCEQTPIWVVSH
tara:strand:- start:2 stop:181 length:180 start_codon:yes stop_codon:yes gene_type:complete